ncbi:MAG: RNA methyltransferase [archaeon]
MHRQEKVDFYYKNKIKDFGIVIDNFADPHNVAAISRTADGLGVEKVYLYYTYNKVPDLKTVGKKSSSTANKWIKFEQIKDLNSFVNEKKKEGWTIIGADECTGAENLTEFKFPGKCLLVMGAEHGGISPELRKVCDSFVFIPMLGMVESYNVSVAAGMFMYELFRQKGKGLVLRKRSKNTLSRSINR